MGFSDQATDILFRTICNITYGIPLALTVTTPVCFNHLGGSGLYNASSFIYSHSTDVVWRKWRVMVNWRHIRWAETLSQCLTFSMLMTCLFWQMGACMQSITKLRQLLQSYEQSSGQKINFEKSGSKFISASRVQRIEAFLGCKRGKFPITYLGAPIWKVRGRSSFFFYSIKKRLRLVE